METTKYQGKMFAIVDKEIDVNGKTITIEVGRRAPGVRLIIEATDGALLLTKEYRPELGRYDIRLPGGKVFDSLAEYQTALSAGTDLFPAIEAAARLEAKEEVGIDSGDFTRIHTSIAGLTVDWDLHYFVVKNPVEGAQALGEHEDIEVARISREDAKKFCLDGSISEERSALVLLRYLSQNT
jgi:8-oxo-dGTP pyrophosphatase MutT (NUDIX family)